MIKFITSQEDAPDNILEAHIVVDDDGDLMIQVRNADRSQWQNLMYIDCDNGKLTLCHFNEPQAKAVPGLLFNDRGYIQIVRN